MSTSDIWSSLILNLNHTTDVPRHDNYIVGAAYARELWYPGYGFAIGVEVGIADRFGHYEACCLPIVRVDDVRHSLELWGGFSIGHAGALLGGVRIKPMIVLGFSGITKPIGTERQLEAQRNNHSAKVLFFVAPELAFSTTAFPNMEIVWRLQHRSGLYGTIGAMREGYNGNVLGARYRF